MHEQTKAALLRAENFIDVYGDDLPHMNVEVLDNRAEFHIHIRSAGDLTRVHDALGTPTWTVSGTDTSAATVVDDIPVTIYYSGLRDEPEAQAPLRHLGLVKGLAVVQ
jgi:hypothetical protein